MKEGVLTRTFTAVMPSGRVAEVTARRFLSMSEPEKAAISYSVKITGGSGTAEVTPCLNADVHNEDANYDEKFWEKESAEKDGLKAAVRCTDPQDSLRGGNGNGECIYMSTVKQ